MHFPPQDLSKEKWPALPYPEFKETSHLLHMCVQIIGKLKLSSPFEPHWGNVILFLTSVGLTTGPIPYHDGSFSIEIDFLNHRIVFLTSWGKTDHIILKSMSVAEFFHEFFLKLQKMEIQVSINNLPQEVENPIPFGQDTNHRAYDYHLVNNWWKILHNSYHVLQIYHARFRGISPPAGFMWGTFDLRDARYNGIPVKPTGINTDYIRRNAMDEGQVEAGWWSGNPNYPQGAYYSFTYLPPAKIEEAQIKPEKARFEKKLGEFILDYDDLRLSKNPESDLLAFFESTYQAGATLANWDPNLVTSGKPV